MSQPLIEYDTNGKVSRIKFSGDREHWFTCDSSGNVINHKAIQHNVETEESYLPSGTPTYRKDCYGNERWYDPKGELIKRKWEGGSWDSYDYDDRGNRIHSKSSDGIEEWNEYDINNNLIHSWDSEGNKVWIEYDDEGLRTHSKWGDGVEEWYDSDGYTSHYKHPAGFEEYYSYDDSGITTHTEPPNPESEVDTFQTGTSLQSL